MTEAPKRPSKGQRVQDRDSTKRSNKSPIRAPPRVVLGQGRASKAKEESHEQHGAPSSEKTPPKTSSQSQASPSRASLAEKVKQLEEELKVMEDAFRKEHDQLSKRAIDESERAALAQERYSDVHRDFLNKDTELKMLLMDVERQLGERERKTKYEWEAGYRQDRRKIEEALIEARIEAQNKEEENAVLRRQVLGLKEFVSTNRRTEGQVTDDVIAMRVKKLDGDLQNWVLSNFRRLHLDFTALDDARLQSLSLPVSVKYRNPEIPTLRFLQSILSRILATNIFSLYFVGLVPERAAELKVVEEFMSTIGDASSVNNWRSTTLSIIRRSSNSSLASATKQFIDTLVQNIDKFLSDLGAPQSASRNESLKTILQEATELAQLFRVQKARLEMSMFEEKTIDFDEEIMEDVGGEEGDDETRVSCVISPAVIKYGDEDGEDEYLRNVLVKGKVLLEQ